MFYIYEDGDVGEHVRLCVVRLANERVWRDASVSLSKHLFPQIYSAKCYFSIFDWKPQSMTRRDYFDDTVIADANRFSSCLLLRALHVHPVYLGISY